ncbi:hypothetical protein BH24GEM3_BH24GEM3_24500 [soil metagenome]
MSDALVQLLNSKGYQPVFLPRTAVEPPELYNFANRRLVRRGPLAHYLPADTAAQLKLTPGELPDIEHRETSGKRGNAAASFLENALKSIGISSIPKLNLTFTRGRELVFAFSEVSYKSIDPSVIDHIVQQIEIGAIPQSVINAGMLHIVYEYAYARKLLMSRADHQAFELGARGDVGEFINLGAEGKVEAQSATTLAFSGSDDRVAAFAYKAGRLERRNGRWEFYPEEVMRTRGAETTRDPFLVARGVVLPVEDQE